MIGVGMLCHACLDVTLLLCGCFVMIRVWMLCHDWCVDAYVMIGVWMLCHACCLYVMSD